MRSQDPALVVPLTSPSRNDNDPPCGPDVCSVRRRVYIGGKPMRFKYTIASFPAIVGGVAAAGGAIALLVRDAFISGWTVELALMPVIVGLAILSGHLSWRALCGFRLLAAAGLTVLSILCSGFVVYETMGRRAEVRDVKVASAVDTEKRRQHLQTMLREAEEILAKHRALLSQECASGTGKRCSGITYSVMTWESAVAGYETQIKKLGPQTPADPKADRFAAVLSLFVGAKDADIKRNVATFEPIVLPLILEFGSMVLFGFGFSSSRRQKTVAVQPAEQVTPVADQKPLPPKGGTMTKLEAERDLVMILALGKPISSQDELAERWNVGKGTISKWMVDWEERGLVTRAQYGRCKQIVAA